MHRRLQHYAGRLTGVQFKGQLTGLMFFQVFGHSV